MSVGCVSAYSVIRDNLQPSSSRLRSFHRRLEAQQRSLLGNLLASQLVRHQPEDLRSAPILGGPQQEVGGDGRQDAGLSDAGSVTEEKCMRIAPESSRGELRAEELQLGQQRGIGAESPDQAVVQPLFWQRRMRHERQGRWLLGDL